MLIISTIPVISVVLLLINMIKLLQDLIRLTDDTILIICTVEVNRADLVDL